MRALVVDDEVKTAAFLRKGLTQNGFKVDVAHYGTDALKLANDSDYDIIILDIIMPGINGWEVLKKLREKQNMTPVICLTALDDVDDRIKGLKMGADDYLIKPFTFNELTARISAILRRGQAQRRSSIYTVADLEFDIENRKVIRDGERIELTPKEFSILSLFVRKKGDVLSRTQIAERVWNVDYNFETNVVDVHMRRLRAKVDEPFNKKLIHTVRGVGYVLEDR